MNKLNKLLITALATLKKSIKLCKVFIMSGLIKVLWVLPMQRNRIFLQSYEKGNGFTDNPKYLCEYMHRMYPNQFEYIFAFNKDWKGKEKEDADYIKKVRKGSFKWLYYITTAKVVVVNVRMSTALSRRKGQLIINTWHAGGAFKKTGVHKHALVGAWKERRHRKFISLFVSSSKVFTESNIESGMHYKGKILPCGMPRNDMFFSEESVKQNAEKVKSEYKIGDAICVLFAPTFRGNGQSERVESLPPLNTIAKKLKEKFQRDVVILVRKHHRDKNEYDMTEAVIDVSAYPDVQDIICCCDILITDYSSIMWDFALRGGACFLFIPDFDQYEHNRGFFTPVEEWPGIVCRNEKELLDEIENIDFARSKTIAENYLKAAESYETGNAAKAISDYIIDYLK